MKKNEEFWSSDPTICQPELPEDDPDVNMKSSLAANQRLINKVKKFIQIDEAPLIVGKVEESCGFAVEIHYVVHRQIHLKLS